MQTGPRLRSVKDLADDSIPHYYEKLEKTFKQYSDMTSESFSKYQNDLLLNSTILEGMEEALASLTKIHKLS